MVHALTGVAVGQTGQDTSPVVATLSDGTWTATGLPKGLAIAAGAFLAMVAYLDSHLNRGAPGVGADASSQAGAYRP